MMIGNEATALKSLSRAPGHLHLHRRLQSSPRDNRGAHQTSAPLEMRSGSASGGYLGLAGIRGHRFDQRSGALRAMSQHVDARCS